MSIESMKMDFHDAIKNAYMTKVPLIVVEGKDDLPVYISLLENKERRFNVKPVQFFKNSGSGCHEIERNIISINERYPQGHIVYNYFKGIVDRDVKEYRNELVERDGMFYLNSYSFENNFVTTKSIVNTVRLLTSLSSEQLDEALTEQAVKFINEQFVDFYYVVLEALRNAIEADYDGLVGFSEGYQELLINPVKKIELMGKRSDLDVFASKHGVSCDCILKMKHFCKGKWHLRYFLQSLINFTNSLHTICGKELVKCPICESGRQDSCMYKKTTPLDVSGLIKVIKDNINNADLDYLRKEIFNLAG
ncbi:DUF4435 domain-containing protein [Shewanella sp. NKUCC05_KAH]|uniref:hypothetical protein n=1 Tax=Shewanella sp. NKUCC05_KAH TaxID=2842126 RepID=UPI001C5B534C|nr:hypothetical protein [Shewanella sp. NKUCC05_KAH]MBW3527682.1 DUF4435 domain-containing protein [Shewanella sp. NKUCC05_KAH]